MTTLWKRSTDLQVIDKYLPDDSSNQTYAFAEAKRIIRQLNNSSNETVKIVDLGCGDGNSYHKFKKENLRIEWLGIDIDESREVNMRTDKNLKILNYDGINIPLPDNSADVIYSHQVFEHVRHPQALLKDIYRVLKHGGFFIGSTSQVEPFHSRSYWNFTAFGFGTLLEESKFKNIFFKPGLDGISLVCHSFLCYLKLRKFTSFLFIYETPFNILIGLITRILGFPKKYVGGLKLIFSGHIIFCAKK